MMSSESDNEVQELEEEETKPPRSRVSSETMEAAEGDDEDDGDQDIDDNENEEDMEDGTEVKDSREKHRKSARTAKKKAAAAAASSDNGNSGQSKKRSTGKRKGFPKRGGSRKGRAPAVSGLTIPFRTVKKAMKLDPDIPIVQNEAAIMTTMAAELFLKQLSKESYQIAKTRGRNTIRYEDVAEARTKDSSMSFLETLLP